MQRTISTILLLQFMVACGVEDEYTSKQRTHPSHSFSDLAGNGNSLERCNNGMLQSCARIDVSGFTAFGKVQQLKGLKAICATEGDSRNITISNALGSSSTFEIKIKMPLKSRGTFSCVSQQENKCELSGYSGGTQFSSAKGKGCIISLMKSEPVEATIFCDRLKTFKSEVRIGESSRFSCPK